MSTVDSKTESTGKDEVQSLVCLVCGTALMTDFISPSQSSKVSLRCGGCGDLIGTGVKANAPRDKKAWWSLWLGLLIPLNFFTGIPAIYLGIRSLLRMRYTSFRLGDRRAAIAGTSLGAVSVMFGVCSIGMLIAIMSAVFSDEQTENLAQAKIALAGVTDIALPEEIVCGEAERRTNVNKFFFGDSTERSKSTCRIVIYYYPPAMIGATVTMEWELRSRKLYDDATYSEIENTKLKWEIAGKRADVSKYIDEEIFEDESGNLVKNEVHQYFGFVYADKGIYAAYCSIRQPNDVFPDEASVEAFFKSLKSADKLRPTEAWEEALALEVEETNEENNKPETDAAN